MKDQGKGRWGGGGGKSPEEKEKSDRNRYGLCNFMSIFYPDEVGRN